MSSSARAVRGTSGCDDGMRSLHAQPTTALASLEASPVVLVYAAHVPFWFSVGPEKMSVLHPSIKTSFAKTHLFRRYVAHDEPRPA